MKFAAADLRKIQSGLFAAVLACAVGAAALAAALERKNEAQTARAAAGEEHREFESKLERMHDDEGTIRQSFALSGALQRRGVIGEEQRLDWIELLRDIRNKHRIDLQYELAPQRELESDAGATFAFYASTMKLQLQLLHEEDLIRVLDDLRNEASALVLVRECTISRVRASDGEQSDRRAGPRANLQADCRIDWVTIRERASR